MQTSPLLTQLMEALRCLPGVGPKSAQRMAFTLLQRDRSGRMPPGAGADACDVRRSACAGAAPPEAGVQYLRQPASPGKRQVCVVESGGHLCH